VRTIVGVDLGATNVRAAVVDEAGTAAAPIRRAVPRGEPPAAVADAVAALAREAASGREIAAVGVGLAGWLDPTRQVVRVGPNLGFRDVPFGPLLADRLPGSTVVLVNDLRSIAWGEYLYGSGQGACVLLVVFFGSGVGSSVVANGRPLEGSTNIACEIGHVRVVPRGGRACGCGQLGCLEAYVGGHNLERRARHDIEVGAKTVLTDLVGGRLDAITCATIEAAVALDDRYASSLWSEAAAHGGQVLGSLVTYLNPDRLIVGGGVWAGCAALRERALKRLRRSATPSALEACRIVEPALSDLAGILGAAAFAREALGST